ncbi:lysozyme [Delftia acidovorans CCUG 274B]|uniref:lysozyme n=1 Tax=Delftia acidovorans TaxID=80866 RepID=UPI000352E338|nr:glycoside hydrolase family protein [Delftia acidovorans]EPD44860.1 lysozyme [Delftia acidovorans CCUG 274B]
MNEVLRNRLLATAAGLAVTAAGGYVATQEAGPSPAVTLAREIGRHYESSGRHIGMPYVDRLGRGQPLTVCAGVTGPEVVAGRYYTPEDCEHLELPKYREAERQARRALRHWDTYNVWVQASFIDMAYNVPSALAPDTTVMRMANAGQLDAACLQMPRWVYGMVNGVPTRLPGLVDRRDATRELCAQWGRDGHFSVGLLARASQ